MNISRLAAGLALGMAGLFAVTLPLAAAQEKEKPQVVTHGTPKAGLPHVRIVGIGGTITNTATAPHKWLSYSGQRITLGDLLGQMEPGLSEIANISTYELPSLGSSSAMSAEVLLTLSKVINDALAEPDVDAVVLTSGTSVMEEVAYWLDLTVASPKPLILTGSMRPSNTLSADGAANLFNSITLAASGASRCFGSVLLLNDRFYSARDVRKVSSVRVDAFTGGEAGFLGYVDEDRVRAVNAPPRALDCGTDAWKAPFDVSTLSASDIAKVDIVYSYIEASGAPITALAQAGTKGIVLAGHGSGGISKAQSAATKEAVEAGVLFVATTRVGNGPVYSKMKGVLSGEDLLPQKARILLQLALSVGATREEAAALFERHRSPGFDFSAR